MATHFVDYEGGNNGNDGLSFANRKATLASVTTAAAGETIKIMGSPAATSTGQNATLTNKSRTVTLTSAVNASVYNDGAWTAIDVVNVTCATSGTCKEGSNSSSIVIGSGFTTGPIAFFATGTLDLSAYEQISFQIRPSTDVVASRFRIDLCSDAVGLVPVNSLTITQQMFGNAACWTAMVLDNAGALDSAIESIAIYALSDPGTITLLIDNIVACKASSASDCITHHTLIGKNDGDWFCLKSIVGTTLTIDNDQTSLVGSGRGFTGTTATTTLYVKQPIVIPYGGTNLTYASGNGTSGSLITVSGGWNRTDMSTQTLDSFFTFTNCSNFTSGFVTNASDFISVSKIGIARAGRDSTDGVFKGASTSGTDWTFTDCTAISGSNSGWNLASAGQLTRFSLINCRSINTNGDGYNCNVIEGVYTGCRAIGTNSAGWRHTTTSVRGVIFGNCVGSNNGDAGCDFNGYFGQMYSLTFDDNANNGLNLNGLSSNIVVVGLTCRGNTGFGINTTAGNSGLTVYGYTSSTNTTSPLRMNDSLGYAYLYDATMAEATKVTFTTTIRAMVFSQREGGDRTVNVTRHPYGTISTNTSTKPAEVDFSYNFKPTNANLIATEPLRYKVGVFACLGGVEKTITYQARRDSTSLSMALRVRGGCYPGVGSAGSDIVTNVNPSVDTWTPYSVVFTPSEDCVVEVFAEAYGGTTLNGYIAGPLEF